jgi:hypothetical protein
MVKIKIFWEIELKLRIKSFERTYRIIDHDTIEIEVRIIHPIPVQNDHGNVRVEKQ